MRCSVKTCVSALGFPIGRRIVLLEASVACSICPAMRRVEARMRSFRS
jgi:hypothetical protein